MLHNCSTIGLQQYRITCGVAHRSTSWSRATGHERSPLELLDLAVGDVQVGAQARYLRAQAADLSLGAVHPAHEVSTLLVELAL